MGFLMINILKYGLVGAIGFGGALAVLPVVHADSIKSGDVVQIARNARWEKMVILC